MLSMAQLGRYWPVFRSAMKEATGELLGPESMSITWLANNAADLLELIPKLDAAFATRTAAEWVAFLREHDLLIEVVQDYSNLASDPQIVENGMIATLDHPAHGPLPIVAPNVNLSETPGTIRTPAPEFGQHTEEVLLEAGYSWEELEALRESGVIGAPVSAP
jgi:crotonobetainyl-CoA:carnitine CoA-transferase CaiB-like acyl-CoA transferase